MASMKQSSILQGVAQKGRVLQVVSTTKTDVFATTSTTNVDISGLSVAITPAATTSKIIVILSTNARVSTPAVISVVLLRNSTEIGGGLAAGSRPSAFRGAFLSPGDTGGVFSGEHLDSPSTTSEITYKVQTKTNTGTISVNQSGADADNSIHPRLSSTITVMEVAG